MGRNRIIGCQKVFVLGLYGARLVEFLGLRRFYNFAFSRLGLCIRSWSSDEWISQCGRGFIRGRGFVLVGQLSAQFVNRSVFLGYGALELVNLLCLACVSA